MSHMHMPVAQSCPTLCDSMDRSPPGSSVHGIFPGKNTQVGCNAHLQGLFSTQGSNLGVLCPQHGRWIFYHWASRNVPQTQANSSFHLHLFPPIPLGFTKGHSAVMSQAGHRVSQLPQRLPDTLRREDLKGQAAAAGGPHSCPRGFVSQPWISWLLLQKSHRICQGPARMAPKLLPRLWEVPCVTRGRDLNSGCPRGCGEGLGTDVALLKIGSLLGFQLIRPSLPLGGIFMIYLEKSLPGSQKTMIVVVFHFLQAGDHRARPWFLYL